MAREKEGYLSSMSAGRKGGGRQKDELGQSVVAVIVPLLIGSVSQYAKETELLYTDNYPCNKYGESSWWSKNTILILLPCSVIILALISCGKSLPTVLLA